MNKPATTLNPAFDLEERTAVFGESVIEFFLTLALNPITSPLITQFVKSATSVGANYDEADEAESKSDCRHKIAVCRKESKETKHWCRMMAPSPCVNLGKKLMSFLSFSEKSSAPPTQTCVASGPTKTVNPPKPPARRPHWTLGIGHSHHVEPRR